MRRFKSFFICITIGVIGLGLGVTLGILVSKTFLAPPIPPSALKMSHDFSQRIYILVIDACRLCTDHSGRVCVPRKNLEGKI